MKISAKSRIDGFEIEASRGFEPTDHLKIVRYESKSRFDVMGYKIDKVLVGFALEKHDLGMWFVFSERNSTVFVFLNSDDAMEHGHPIDIVMSHDIEDAFRRWKDFKRGMASSAAKGLDGNPVDTTGQMSLL